MVFICFSKAFANGECTNLVCSITPLWSGSSISSSVEYSYLSIFPNGNADIFAASLLISYCNFSYQLSWLVFMFFLSDFLENVKDYQMQE